MNKSLYDNRSHIFFTQRSFVFPKGTFVKAFPRYRFFCSLTSLTLATLGGILTVLVPGMGEAAPALSPESAPEPALVFTVSVSDQNGKSPRLRTVTYTITDDAMRIDAPAKDADRSYLWNLSARTVASLDNEKKTYHADSLDKIMGFVDFSQLLGQSAGNNPKDRVVRGTVPRTVAGVTCTDTTTLHRFKGRVVGMINGDQKIVQCLATVFPGSDLYRTFQEGLAALAKKAAPDKTGAPPPFTPLSLETVRTTDYSKGFLVKILSALHLYDSSKIPARQVERETVTELSVRPVPPDTFTIPASYKKETAPAS